MELLIRQRVFSWSDTYDVYDETGAARYYVEAEILSLGHQIHVYDKRSGQEVGSIHQRLMTFLPTFDIVIDGCRIGSVRKEFSFFLPRYHVDYRGWDVEGDFLEWDYRVLEGNREVVSISKQPFRWGDTYVLTYGSPREEISALLLVIAIDAANCGK